MEVPDYKEPFVLGIDLGTTSVKVAVVDADGSVVENVTLPSLAAVDSDAGNVGAEQSAEVIWSALQAGLRQIDPQNQVKVGSVGITGQMHGLLLWRQGKSWSRSNDQTRHIELHDLSPLYTWQDGRCSPDFLSTLPQPQSHLRLASGYGCVTYLWLMRHRGSFLAARQFDAAGTVMDFVVAAICDLDRPKTSDQLAASFGYFDVQSRSWNSSVLKSAGFPVNILPEVLPGGQVAGHVQQGLDHVPAGTPVLVAMGDMQCGMLSAFQNPSDAMLNISTSIQLSFRLSQESDLTDLGTGVEVVPYFDNARLAVAAGLNGGATLTALVDQIKQWILELGFAEDVIDSALFEKLLSLGESSPSENTLSVNPTIFGERHDPALLGSVAGISPSNATLGAIFRATSEGIIDNIFGVLPVEVLVARGVKRVVGSGSVLSWNSLVRKRVEKTLEGKLDFVPGSQSDSAFGAAKAALSFLQH